uniref:Xeroderma pigmentosum, complementation group C n=1 Tax=Seriola dumerili TaxID=41447 RepID=A0A3B4UWM5_SERDU
SPSLCVHPGNGITEKEDTLERKVKAKKRRSPKPPERNNSPSKTSIKTSAKTSAKTSIKTSIKTSAKTSTAAKTSKYFQSPVKQLEIDSEDEFDMVTSPPPVVKVNAKKPEREEKEEEEEEEEEMEEDSEEDEDDWEEVEGKDQFSWIYLQIFMSLFNHLLIDTHKVHLMCLIASGMFRNRVCSEPDLLAITLSLLPPHFGLVAKERIDHNYLSGLLRWFRATFTLNPSLPCEERPDPRALLERRLASLSARTHQEMTHLFLLVLRSLQLFCRLVLSLQPIPFKPPSGKGATTSTAVPGKSQETPKTPSPEPKVSPGSKRPAGAKGERGGKRAKRKDIKEEEAEEKVKTSGGQRPKNSKRRSVASKVSYREESNSEQEEWLSDEDEFQASEEESEDSEREEKSTKKNNKKTAAPKRRSGGGTKQVKAEGEEEEDGDEGEAKQKSGKKKKRREGPGADEWLEVYLEKTSSWVCVDVEHGVGMPHLCSQNATAPVTYVVSVDGDGFVKDMGRKYDPTWMTSSRKRRVDDDWWEETLEPFLGPEDERDVQEDKELQKKLLNKPLPISITEYKNHPLYALKRHLLKYEAIFPPTASVLGYCRGEPVYSRDCVHTLHSRDTWLKEARTVRLGEEPYKMVRGFSNRSRKARMMSEQKDENDLPLFGEWQTEEYQPPVAVDGKVPRNDYGNVYLFKPCMLPVGCVHLRLPNLHRVARKLDLDAAPAVTDVTEEPPTTAWVEEQELQKQKEKEKKEKRAISNWTLLVKSLLIGERLKQRYGKKNQGLGGLAHGDDVGGLSSDEEAAGEGGGPGAMTASETLAMSWPQNRQAEEDGGSGSGLKKKTTTKREKRGQEEHLFPFEKV